MSAKPTAKVDEMQALSREELEAKVASLQADVDKLVVASASRKTSGSVNALVWNASKTEDGKYVVNIPTTPGGGALCINGEPMVGIKTLTETQLQQVAEYHTRCQDMENHRYDVRGNAAPIELVPQSDVMSRRAIIDHA